MASKNEALRAEGPNESRNDDMRDKIEAGDALPDSQSITSSKTDIEAEPKKTSYKDDYGSTDEHVFSEPKIADYWRNIYEKAQYEGRHRFDPTFTWTAEEEIKLKRKVDWRIITWAWIMFFSLDLNRRNANQAISDDMLPELGMDTNDFNTGQTIFLVSFLCAELPSGLISKKLGKLGCRRFPKDHC